MNVKEDIRNNATSSFRTNAIGFWRYKKIIIGIGLFLLITAFVVIETFVISSSIKDVSSGINLAGRQRMLSQRTAKLVGVIGFSHTRGDEEAMSIAKKELLLTYTLFDETLNAFADGGDTIGADGKTLVNLTEIRNPELRVNIDHALAIWSDFGPRVQNLAAKDTSSLSAEDVEKVVTMSAQYNLVLLKLMNNLTQGLESEANKKADMLKVVQGAGLLLVLVNFGWVAVSALGSLSKNDRELEATASLMQKKNENLELANNNLAISRRDLDISNNDLNKAYSTLQEYNQIAEMKANELEDLSRNLNILKEEGDTILNSVDHGLCLIDHNFKIGKRVSSVMYDIFETELLVERSLVDLLRPLITEKDIRTLESYLKLQFNPKTSNKQLDKFNPLKKIEITLNWDGKGFSNKHLGFNFERIINNDEIQAVLVTITNITDTVMLENQLKQANEEQERNTLLIMDIMRLDRQELSLFLTQTTRTLDDINDLLQNNGIIDGETEIKTDYVDLVEPIFRKIHNIKGNASMLSLKSVVSTTQTVESKLTELRSKKNINSDDFLGSLVELAYLRELLTNYDELNSTLFSNSTFSAGTKSNKLTTKSEKIVQELQNFIDTLGDDLGKEAFLKASFPINDLSNDLLVANKNIMIQLIRNSMAHGIESAEERKKLGKWGVGSCLKKK